jgi:hypothetical protein
VDARRVESVVEQLRRGSSVALAGAVGPDATATLERELTALGRTTIWIDLDGAESGAELGGRIVEGCMHHLDPEALGDVLERLPTRGRIDLEAFAELLMLPERIAESSGKRVVAILEGFQQVERVIGFVGLSAVRDALILRDRVSYLFVGGRRLEALFSRPDMPLYGLAEVEVVGEEKGGRRRDRRRQPAPPAPEAPPPSDDPLTSALLAWAEPPAKAEPEPTSPAQEAWERLLARESMERDWFERLERDPDEDEGDRWWRRGRRRR